MARFTFALSALLAAIGVASALIGIAANEFKPVAVGFVLLSGATVFALLYVGARRGAAPIETTSPEAYWQSGDRGGD